MRYNKAVTPKRVRKEQKLMGNIDINCELS